MSDRRIDFAEERRIKALNWKIHRLRGKCPHNFRAGESIGSTEGNCIYCNATLSKAMKDWEEIPVLTRRTYCWYPNYTKDLNECIAAVDDIYKQDYTIKIVKDIDDTFCAEIHKPIPEEEETYECEEDYLIECYSGFGNKTPAEALAIALTKEE